MVGSASDPLSERHGWTAEEIRSHWNWAPGSSFLNNSEFSLTWRLVRNALSLRGLNFKAGLADMPDCPRCGSELEETAEHAFYHCERVCPFWYHVGEWTARIEPKQLVLLDVCYVVDNLFLCLISSYDVTYFFKSQVFVGYAIVETFIIASHPAVAKKKSVISFFPTFFPIVFQLFSSCTRSKTS